MKKQNDLAKIAFNFAFELFRMRDLFPLEERTELALEMVQEAVTISACISTAIELEDDDLKNELLPKAFSATFRIEVMLEISRYLKCIKTIDKQLRTLVKIRKKLEEIMNTRVVDFPY